MIVYMALFVIGIPTNFMQIPINLSTNIYCTHVPLILFTVYLLYSKPIHYSKPNCLSFQDTCDPGHLDRDISEAADTVASAAVEEAAAPAGALDLEDIEIIDARDQVRNSTKHHTCPTFPHHVFGLVCVNDTTDS